MTVLALAYWNEPGLPDGFEKVPVESVEKTALWLREHSFEKVGLWGISMGAELALLAGSLMPELVYLNPVFILFILRKLLIFCLPQARIHFFRYGRRYAQPFGLPHYISAEGFHL